MARVVGSYPSVVLGISEQVPQDRRPGQHTQQVNFISDPVRGLARRHGSVLMDSVNVPAGTGISEAAMGITLSDLKGYGEATFFVAGTEYSMLYRQAPAPASAAPAFVVYDKDNQKFIPVVRPPVDTLLDQLATGGVSASVNVGKYLFLAGNEIIPKYTVNDKFGSNQNKEYHVVWIRGGAYSRGFTVFLNMADGSTKTVTHKTMASSYPEILDTSDIPFSDPNYNQKVSQRTTKYNSEVNKWIGDAAADIQPGAIATKMGAAIIAAGIPAAEVKVIGSHICIGATTVITSVTGNDGGDGQLLRAVSNEIKAAEETSQIHFAGKVVKIRPKKNSGHDAYYIVAIPYDASATGFTEVTWRESAGYIMTPADVFIMGTVVSDVFYMASTATLLESLTKTTHPAFRPNPVGDDVSAPAPFFFGHRITCMFMFQDRLTICSEAVVFMSRPGDYFSWFRGSVLSIEDDDPVEMFAKGAEDDTLRVATTYDRNTLLFGDRHQYVLNGRAPMTPKTATIVVLSAYEDAVDAAPINSGNYVFYAKYRNELSSLHQVQMGQLVDSPESFEVSQQLDQYLKGRPVQLVALTAPNFVFFRTSDLDNGIYLYQYIDTPAGTERLFDSWSKWQWDKSLGTGCGMTQHDGDLIVFTARQKNGKMYIVADRFYRDTALSALPYFDSAFQYPGAFPANKWDGDDVNGAIAFDRDSKYFLLGHDLNKAAGIVEQYPADLRYLWAGVECPAFVIPTNPYTRDKNDKAIVNGRLTITRFSVSVVDTAGMVAETRRLRAGSDWQQVLDFTGRILNDPSNVVGRQPVVTTTLRVPVMRETTEFEYALNSRRWLPLTISAIEWQGQSFNNARRI